MIGWKHAGWIVPTSAGLVLGIGIGAVSVSPSLARPTTLQKNAPANPQEHALDANLYMQTSAEYRACCLEIYGWMTERLRTKLTAQDDNGLLPAVVMDLDETVLDNAGYQSFLDRERLNYSEALWETWEKDYPAETRLVPGAKAFIEAAENMGVTIIYISNRLTRNKAATIEALRHNGINTDNIEERLRLKDMASDKTSRRQAVSAKYHVLLLAGDNLRDFSEEFVAPKTTTNAERETAIMARGTQVDRRRARWGNDWFILPNPVYGEWQRLLSPDAHEQIRQTAMQPPAH